MDLSNLFGGPSYFCILPLLICAFFRNQRSGRLIRQIMSAQQNDALREKSQGERCPIPLNWNTHVKPFDNPLNRGFKRPGNLCFRNATIALLVHSPILFKWLSTYVNYHKHKIPDGGGCTLCALYKVMQMYWSEGRLRKEHEERMNTLCNIVASLYPDHNTGSFLSNRTSITVEDAIKEAFTNYITESNCEGCQKKTGYRTDWFASSPENLFVQFHGDTQKTNTQIQLKNRLVIPEGCIFEELQDKRKLEYELYGVVFQKGMTFQGHYTIAVRGPNEGWTEIDDPYRGVRGQEQSKASYPPNNPPSAPYLKVPATKPVFKGEFNHAGPDNNGNQFKLKQTIRPGGAAMLWAHILDLDHFAGTLFEPKDQDIELGMKFTLSTGEVVEGSGSISLILSGSRKRARAPAEIANAKMAKKRKTEPKAAAKEASKQTRHAEFNAPYESNNPRR